MENLNTLCSTGDYKIVIVENHEKLRNVLHDWLVGQFPRSRFILPDSPGEALRLLQSESPDLILLDIDIHRDDPLFIASCKAAHPGVEVILLADAGPAYLREKIQAAGASEVVLKHRMLTDLLPAIEQRINA